MGWKVLEKFPVTMRTMKQKRGGGVVGDTDWSHPVGNMNEM
jgi:hypothetical protein